MIKHIQKESNLKLTKTQRLLHRITENWVLYLFVLPAMVYYIVFHYVPLYGIQIAFQDYKVGQIIGTSEWVWFKHFKRFFNSAWFDTVLKNTLTLSILDLLIGFPLPIILALLLNEVKNMRFRKLVQTVSYAPHFISMVVLCGAVTMFLSPSTGLLGVTINTIRGWMGLKAINLSADGDSFKWIYTLSGIWQQTGWGSVIYLAALSGVDPQLQEAAEVDGANKFQRMININLPVLFPTIIIMLILKCGNILDIGYEKVYLLQNSAILQSSEVISTYVYRSGLQGAQYSYATAVSLFNSFVNCTLLIIVNQITRKIDRESSLW